jgi:acetyltransferase-like isoleucine patch superfamily enzyme
MKNLIYRRLQTFINDPFGSVLWELDGVFLKLMSLSRTAQARTNAFLWGIELGKSSRFYGKIYFKRYPQSKIAIGKKCVFRSSPRSNMAGLNRSCAISTHTKEAEIFIGKRSGFSGTVIGAAESIKIGDNVSCGANVTITDFDWHNLNPSQRSGPIEVSSPVVIEDNVWLGLNCLVLKGVHIGKNSIIGANSVVASSIPANVIAVGNPARIVRKLTIPEK